MPVHDDLGLRMKNSYESRARSYLTRRTPVIIRIDGRAFHTFTRGFKRPYDPLLMRCMQDTMKYLCENIQGCVLGYTQSDEISLLLVDYKELTSDSWFDYQVQKICSISASLATLEFNRVFNQRVIKILGVDPKYCLDFGDAMDLQKAYEKALDKGAMFDSRCFNIPKEEVANYFFWRQEDATRNSIQMAGQAYFSHKELQGKNCNQIQDMLHEIHNINWNDYPVEFKRGTCCRKIYYTETAIDRKTKQEKEVTRSKWEIDKEIPIFKGDDRYYIDNLVFVGV